MNKTINQYINQLHLDPKREAAVRKIVTLAGGSGGGGMVEITYAELKELRDNGKLVPGCKYRMIDYETTTSQEGTQAAGHPFDLILTALDEKTLDEKCSAIQSARDVDGYFANSNLAAWEVWYTLDNDSSRFTWAVEKGKKLIIDFSALDMPEPVKAILNGIFDYEGTTYFKWDAIIEGTNVYILTLTEDNLIGQTPLIYIIDAQMAQPMGIITDLIIDDKNGYGVIYRLIDEYNNDICYDFKNLLFKRRFNKSNDIVFDNESVNIIGDIYVYTFCERRIRDKDFSILGCTKQNKIIDSFNIVLALNTEGKAYNNNIISSNIISVLGIYNKIKKSKNCIISGDYNTIDKDCYNIKLYYSNNCKIGYNSHDIYFQAHFYNVIVDSDCYNIKFQDLYTSMDIGGYVKNIIIKKYVNNLTIRYGKSTSSGSLTNMLQNYIISKIGDDYSSVTLDRKISYIKNIIINNNDSIIEYSQEDIYNAIQATKSES